MLDSSIIGKHITSTFYIHIDMIENIVSKLSGFQGQLISMTHLYKSNILIQALMLPG